MKKYKNKWIMQRITALILIPLSFWFIITCLSFSSMQYFEIIIFFNSALNSFLFLLMIIVTLIHSKLGCDNIIEDYVSTNYVKILSKRIINLFIYLLIFVVILSIIKVSLL